MVFVGNDFFLSLVASKEAVVCLLFSSLGRHCLIALPEYDAQTLDRTGNLLSILIERGRLRQQPTQSHLNYTASASIGVDSALRVGRKSSLLKVLILDVERCSSDIGWQAGKQEPQHVMSYFDRLFVLERNFHSSFKYETNSFSCLFYANWVRIRALESFY